METKVAATLADRNESLVVCHNSHGVEIQGTVLRFSRYQIVFESYAAAALLRTSEGLSEFKILLNGRPVYSGRAVVSGLVNAGSSLVCEATLDDSWMDIQPVLDGMQNRLDVEFVEFLQRWQSAYKVLPEFKVVVVDMQSMLAEMRLWLDQVEWTIRSSPTGERVEMERQAARELAGPILPTIDALGDRFEE